MTRKSLMLAAVLLASTLMATAASRESLTARLTTTSLTVTGNCEKTGWIGISVYSPTDSKGWHQVRQVKAGSLQEVFRVSLTPGGRYEMALWDRRVSRSSCPTKCSWCKLNGYHMEGMRAYHAGAITRASK